MSAELWHIFHDELDLDGNGHLDADELELALQKAGMQPALDACVSFLTSLQASNSPPLRSLNS